MPYMWFAITANRKRGLVGLNCGKTIVRHHLSSVPLLHHSSVKALPFNNDMERKCMRTNKGRVVSSSPSGWLIGAGLLLSCAITVLTGCARPFYVWEAHTYATPMPTSFNTSALGQER